MEIAVCDDNKLFLKEIEGQLRTLPMVGNVRLFNDLDEFLFSVDSGQRYDVVLMDIEWHEKVAGLDAAAELFRLCPEVKIIFVTGRVERYSQQIFLQRSNLSGYLTKPVDTELLRANLRKVQDMPPSGEQTSLVLRHQGAQVTVPVREICFIESQNHTVHVHLAGETVTAYERLESILRVLPDGFCQCHKSYIVNLSHIRRFQPGGVLLKNGELVPVSRSKYNDAKKAYFHFMGHTF